MTFSIERSWEGGGCPPGNKSINTHTYALSHFWGNNFFNHQYTHSENMNMEEDRRVAISEEAKQCLCKLALLKCNTWVSNKNHIGKGVNYHQPSESKGQNTHCGIPDPSAISLPGHSSQGPWPHQHGPHPLQRPQENPSLQQKSPFSLRGVVFSLLFISEVNFRILWYNHLEQWRMQPKHLQLTFFLFKTNRERISMILVKSQVLIIMKAYNSRDGTV